jgi:hypothetical protein
MIQIVEWWSKLLTLLPEDWYDRRHLHDRWSKKPTLLPEDWPERIHIVERWNKLLTLPPVDWQGKIQLYGHEEGLRIWHAYTTHVL